MYVLLVKPFVGKPGADLIVIITTIAGASFMQNGVQVIFGPRYKQLDRILKGPPLQILETAIGLQEVLIIVLTPLTLFLLHLFLKHSKLGLAIRAVAQNDDFARPCRHQCEPDLSADLRREFYPGGTCAASCWAAYSSSCPPWGAQELLFAFVVVVFGGLGSLPGTIVGAYVIGFIRESSAYIIDLYWAPVVLLPRSLLFSFSDRGA